MVVMGIKKSGQRMWTVLDMVLQIVRELSNWNIHECSMSVVCVRAFVCVWSIESNETGSQEKSTTQQLSSTGIGEVATCAHKKLHPHPIREYSFVATPLLHPRQRTTSGSRSWLSFWLPSLIRILVCSLVQVYQAVYCLLSFDKCIIQSRIIVIFPVGFYYFQLAII